LPKSFISKILAHAANARIKDHTITQIKTYWIVTYDLNRMRERTKDEDARVLIEQSIKEICGNGGSLNGISIDTEYHPLELWAFACRWAELELRKNQ
jgi:CRISPR-associated protein Csm1